MPDPVEQPGRNLAPRLEFIEWRLFWEGRLNRSDLEERFGISTPQASVDLRHYRKLAGANIEYDATQKRFCRLEGYEAALPSGLRQSPTASTSRLGERHAATRGFVVQLHTGSRRCA